MLPAVVVGCCCRKSDGAVQLHGSHSVSMFMESASHSAAVSQSVSQSVTLAACSLLVYRHSLTHSPTQSLTVSAANNVAEHSTINNVATSRLRGKGVVGRGDLGFDVRPRTTDDEQRTMHNEQRTTNNEQRTTNNNTVRLWSAGRHTQRCAMEVMVLMCRVMRGAVVTRRMVLRSVGLGSTRTMVWWRLKQRYCI